jgi:hypothetical protein
MLHESELKIAVDYDGTIMDYPTIYRQMIYGLRATGSHVTIMTGRKEDTREEDLRRIKDIRFDAFVNSSNFNCYERQLEKWSQDGHISIDRDEIVCLWKAREIVERSFDVVIDDAADKIRLFLDKGRCKKDVMILKSPTDFNQVFSKWGKTHLLEYDR